MNNKNYKEYDIKKNIYIYLDNFCHDEQEKISEEDAENALIYGIDCYRLRFGKYLNVEICLSHLANNQLDIYNKDESKVMIRIITI